MKIELISPELESSYFRFTPKEVKDMWFPRLSLTHIAALTPPDIEVSITDESVSAIDYDKDVDLVGISAMTYLAPRSYEIARRFREKGVKVVFGGIHATALPHEVIQYADAVVIGEAENVWETLLNDFKNGEMKHFYRSDKIADLINLPHPRLDLLKENAYRTVNSVQTTRGCPHGCDFCSVTDFFGKSYRSRPVEDVIREVASLKGDDLVFVDDNIGGNRRYSKNLFEALIPYKKKWASQCSITLADDEELLKLAAEAGCVGMFVGVESISQENLKSVSKGFNKVRRYEEAIKKFHDNGIMFHAGIIFGFDGDDDGVFERTLEFLEKNKVELTLFNLLTPLPGTALFKRLEAEGRLIDRDWSKYNGGYVVFKPQLMTEEALSEGYFWAYHNFYSISSMTKRLLRRGQNRYPEKIVLNCAYRRMVRRAPQGSLTPLAKLISKIQGTIHTTKKELIPQTMEATMSKAQELYGQLDAFLKINVRKYEKVGSSLLIDLEGVIDRITVKGLWKRITMAVEKGKVDIILDFKNVQFATPKALEQLFKKITKKIEETRSTIKLRNISSSLREMIERINLNVRNLLK